MSVPSSATESARASLASLREALLLALIIFTPWFYGTVESRAQLIAHFFLCAIAAVYSWQVLTNPRRKWVNCPFGWLLWGILLLTVVQIVPMPDFAVKVISPSRVTFQTELLPAQAEIISDEIPALSRFPLTISFSAYDTRSFAYKLIFLALIYSIVRNSTGTRSLLQKLAYVCLINAALLSIVGFSQRFSPFPNRILWSTEVTASNPFGPFLNRNHFAFYANLCLGLGFAVMSLDSQSKAARYRIDAQRRGSSRGNTKDRLVGSISDLFTILQNPRSFWVLALGLVIITAILLTQSRGGYLAIVAGAITCFVVWSRQASAKKRIPWNILLPFCVGLTAVGWFATSYMESKITRAATETVDDRSAIWRECSRLIPEFFAAGTGGGTFFLVEPLHRETHDGPNSLYDHAHNEYLEAFIEGGLLRLLVFLAMVVVALWAGYRACRIHENRSSRGLAYGCTFAIATAIIHSVVEFGIHLGSIAILLTVIVAATLSLAQDYRPSSDSGNETPNRTLAVFSAIVFPLLALLMTWQAWKADSASNYRQRTEREREREATADSIQRRLAFSAAALAAQPDNPELLLLRGDCLADAARSSDISPSEKAAEIRKAIACWIDARNRSILLAQPHERIGIYHSYLKSADPASTYFERAKQLLPIDPQIWYACGASYFEAGDDAKAIENWRRSLELQSPFWKAILDSAKTRLSPERMAGELVPNELRALMEEMNYLYPNRNAQASQRRPFLTKAVELLKTFNGKLNSEDNYLEAQFYSELGREAEASISYQAALSQRPGKVEWRVEYAKMLRLMGNFEESAKQLKRAHDDEPGNLNARYWLLHVERELELRK